MSRSPENILLYLRDEEEQAIRQLFEQLAQRGLPVQHQRPHITLTFAREMAPAVVDQARTLLPPLLPADFQRVGVIVFGRKRKQTVAWLLQTSEELEDAARTLNALNPEGRGHRWIPHITMGLRLPREIVPEYIAALDELVSPHLHTFHAQFGAYWRPQAQHLEVFE